METAYSLQMHRELAKYVDYEKTMKEEGINPDFLSYGSRKFIWWKTPNGIPFRRTFSTVIRQYEKDGTLPFDTTNVCITGYNDVLTTDGYIKDMLDEEKNHELGIDLTKVTRNSAKKAYFKCLNCGNTSENPFRIFQVCRQKHAFCVRCSRNFHTSIQEQTLYFYVKRIMDSAVNGWKEIFGNGTYELDIYIPEYRLGIEYDGYAWHKGKVERDDYKYSVCNENGITLLRVGDGKDQSTKCDHRVKTNSILTNEDIQNVMECVSEITGNKMFSEQKINIDEDIYDILKAFRSVLREKSFAFKNPEAAEKWDYELNHGVSPWSVFANTKQKFWFKSKYGPFLKSLNKITSGRPCRHPQEGKDSLSNKLKNTYILFNTENGEEEEVDKHDINRRFGMENIFNVARGANNFFIGLTGYMLFTKEMYTKENVEKYSKLGSKTYRIYTLDEIIEKSKEYDTFKKFRKENNDMYSQIRQNNWFEYIELYQKSPSIPLKNRNNAFKLEPGFKFPNTKLTFVKEVEKKYRKRVLLCKCDCGNYHEVYMTALMTAFGPKEKPLVVRCKKCSYEKRKETRKRNAKSKKV